MTPPYRDVTLGDLLGQLAESLPNHEALVYGQGPRYTFAMLDHEARTIGKGLIAHGVAEGERVVVWATNVPEWVVLQFALAKIGAVLVTANTALRAADVDYLLRQSQAATVVAIRGFRDVDYLQTLRAIGAHAGAIPTLQRIIYIGADPPPWTTPYEALRAAAARVPDDVLDRRSRGVGLDDMVNMQYTSGTTGFPKGVMLSSRNIVNNGYALGQVLAYTPADRLCLCVPLFHCFGCVIGVLGAFTHGSCLCPVEAFDPARVLETIDRERCTALYGVPTMFLAELECPDFARYNLSSLRTGIMAGALCPEPLMRRVMVDMHLPEMTIVYGLTEASPAITHTPRDASIAKRTQTVGPVLPDLEVKIIEPATGMTLRQGARGELCVRGYNVMLGYYENPEATRAAVDAERWLHTGDEASIDVDGYVQITGRIKDLIIRGGENISPKEVEDLLREHPAVADVYVYGIPDDYFGEAVAAAVRVTAGHTTSVDELIAWCRDRLARFKVPREVRFVEAFPMTASGKVQRYKLREEHARDQKMRTP